MKKLLIILFVILIAVSGLIAWLNTPVIRASLGENAPEQNAVAGSAGVPMEEDGFTLPDVEGWSWMEEYSDYHAIVTDERGKAPTAPVWRAVASAEIPDSLRALWAPALERVAGQKIEPVALLAERSDAAQRAVLCTAQKLSAKARPTYVLLCLSEDGQGGVSVSGSVDLSSYAHLPASDAPIAGGWSYAETQEEGLAAFEKAAETAEEPCGEAIRVLSEQLVAGKNYCVLCRAPGSELSPVYRIVTVYRDLSGNAKFTGSAELDLAILSASASGNEANLSLHEG